MVANGTDIVAHVVRPEAADLPPEMAHKVLTWQFTDQDRERVADLLDRNRANALSQSEMNELDTYTVLGDLLNILHAQALLSLKHSATTPRTA
jgi:hypothetical protein